MPVRLTPASRVVTGPRLPGTAPRARIPRVARERRRVIEVCVPHSSTNTSRAGSTPRICLRHSARASSSRSVALRLFASTAAPPAAAARPGCARLRAPVAGRRSPATSPTATPARRRRRETPRRARPGWHPRRPPAGPAARPAAAGAASAPRRAASRWGLDVAVLGGPRGVRFFRPAAQPVTPSPSSVSPAVQGLLVGGGILKRFGIGVGSAPVLPAVLGSVHGRWGRVAPLTGPGGATGGNPECLCCNVLFRRGMLAAATESVGRRNRGLACITRADTPGAPRLAQSVVQGRKELSRAAYEKRDAVWFLSEHGRPRVQLGELLDEVVEAWLAEAKKTHNQGQDFPHRGRLR